jgi:hypothetical protein
MNQEKKTVLKQALNALDLSQSLLEKSTHHKIVLDAYEKLRQLLAEPNDYVPLSQKECDRLQYAQGSWTRKFGEAHKLGWDAAMKAKHETDLPKL